VSGGFAAPFLSASGRYSVVASNLVALRTGDEKMAERRAFAECPRIDRELAEAQRALTDPLLAARITARLTGGDDEVLDDYLTEKLEADERARGEARYYDDSVILPQPGDRKMSDAERTTALALLNRQKNGQRASDDNPLLSTLFERYYAERKLPTKSRLELENAKRSLAESIGGDVPVRSITTTRLPRLR